MWLCGETMCCAFCFIDGTLFIGVSLFARMSTHGFHLVAINSWACTQAYTTQRCACTFVWCLTRVKWEVWQVVLVGNPTLRSHIFPRWQTAWSPWRAVCAANGGSGWLWLWKTQSWRSIRMNTHKVDKKSLVWPLIIPGKKLCNFKQDLSI